MLRTRDGSVLIGKLIEQASDSVIIQMTGGRIVVARSRIAELRVLAPRSLREGEYWIPDPNDTRLFFAPTGRMLARGDGYFSDTYLLLLNFVGGVTSRFTMGGGFSIIPSDNPQNNILYITPKFGILQSERVNVAIGGVAALAGFEGMDDKLRNFGILYGVGTVGSPDASVTLGTGLAYTGNGFAHYGELLLSVRGRSWPPDVRRPLLRRETLGRSGLRESRRVGVDVHLSRHSLCRLRGEVLNARAGG